MYTPNAIWKVHDQCLRKNVQAKCSRVRTVRRRLTIVLAKDDEGRQQLMSRNYELQAKIKGGSQPLTMDERCAMENTISPPPMSAKQYTVHDLCEHPFFYNG